MIDDLVSFGSPEYCLFLALLALSRGLDFFSTWLATPNLVLEANPLAKKLGWRWGILVNLAVCTVFARWPLPAIVIVTTSFLVAARSFQSAWLMRTLGETKYRCWIVERLAESSRGVFVVCLLAQSLLFASVGGALIAFSQFNLVPVAIGAGMVTYAVAVSFFSLLSVRRVWRAAA